MTTRLFKGSTAPIDTSGVSTSTTNFSGAVNIAALPYLTENAELGVPERGDWGSGVVGVCGLLKLNRPMVAIEDAGPGTDVVSEEV